MIEFDEQYLKQYHKGLLWRIMNATVIFFSLILVKFFFNILNRTRVVGKENIPSGGGVLFASNHSGWADTLILPMYTVQPWTLVPFFAPGKEELFKIPVVAQVISAWGSFPVKRKARDTDSMKKIAYFTKYYRTMIFAEGTRSRTGELLRGRSGVGWIIYTARPVVVPALMVNTDQFHVKGIKRFLFAPYRVVFGEPLDLTRFYEQEDTKKNSQAIADEIMEAIAKLREKHKDLYTEPPKLTGYYYRKKKEQ